MFSFVDRIFVGSVSLLLVAGCGQETAVEESATPVAWTAEDLGDDGQPALPAYPEGADTRLQASVFIAAQRAGDRLAEVVAACSPDAIALADERVTPTLVNASYRQGLSGEDLLSLSTAQWNETGSYLSDITVPVRAAALQAEEGALVLLAPGDSAVRQEWQLDANGALTGEVAPDGVGPVRLSCADASRAAELLSTRFSFAEAASVAGRVQADVLARVEADLARDAAQSSLSLAALCQNDTEAAGALRLVAGYKAERAGTDVLALAMSVREAGNSMTVNRFDIPLSTLQISRSGDGLIRVGSGQPNVSGSAQLVSAQGRLWPATPFEDEVLSVDVPCTNADAAIEALSGNAAR